MSIKRKFIASNFLMLIIPLLASLCFLGIFVFKMFVRLPEKTSRLSEQLSADTEFVEVLFFAFIIIMLIVVGTNIIITAYLSRTILKPLSNLKQAADEITQGNLDFDILGSDDYEIAQLCDAFDNMRQRLKISVEKQTQYTNEKNMLLANISHDLRTPLTSIKGYLDGITDGVAQSPEMMEKYILTIKEKADILDRMIDELSAYSKMELGRVVYNFKMVDYLEFVNCVIKESEDDLQKAGMTLVCDLPDEKFYAAIDTEYMRRVLVNVINNAIKYKKPDGGTLMVSAAYEQGGICLVIKDGGIGIKDEDLHNIFDAFYRGDEARSPLVDGHGLGLSLVKKVIEAHHGKVWIKSTPDVGTSVYMFVPVKNHAKEKAVYGE